MRLALEWLGLVHRDAARKEPVAVPAWAPYAVAATIAVTATAAAALLRLVIGALAEHRRRASPAMLERRWLYPQAVAGSHVGVGGDLEDVAGARAWPHEASRRHDEHPSDPEPAVEPRDRDRRAHAERVDRAAASEQHRPTRRQRRSTSQPLYALAPRRRHINPEPQATLAM